MRLNRILRCTASAAVVSGVVFGFAGMAAAQDSPSSIDDIIVTAQKREQSLQDVPIVVTTLSQEALEGAGVRDIKDLQILTPGLTVTSTTSETITSARIRGVGTVGDNPGLESSVGVVIDGVYRPRNGVGFGDLGEMSRIEVLKGPQGTLFGKNTSAGVINIITEAPSFTPGGSFELTGGNYGALGGSASITGPLSEQVAGRLYIAKRERDGFYDVNTGAGPRTQTDDQNQDFWTARGQLLILPSDTASIRLIADYSKRDEYCCVASQIRTGPTGAIIDGLSPGGNGIGGPAAGFGALPFTRQTFANRSTDQQIEDAGLSAEVNLDIDSWNATFTSITAARWWDSVNGSDIDFSSADLFYRLPDGDFGFGLDQLSQEFRLAGSTDKWDWLVGAFFTKESLSRGDSFLFGSAFTPFFSTLITSQLGAPNPNALPCLTAAPVTFAVCTGALTPPPPGFVPQFGPTVPAGSGYVDHYSQASDSVALFTNNSWRVTDQFEMTLGLRYTRESKRLFTSQDNIGGSDAVCSAIRANPLAPAALRGGALCINQLNPDFDGRSYVQKYEDDDISGKFSAQYRFNDQIMAYASYARGYKAGGFNLERSSEPNPAGFPGDVRPIDDTSFASETVDSIEVGFKSTLLDRTLLFNVSYFNQKYEDFQLNTFAGVSFIVESIPELTSEGFDADFFWFSPIEGLSFQGGATYAKTEYGQFGPNDLSVPARFPSLSLLPGAQMSFAPEWSGSAGVSLDRSIGSGLRALFNLTGKYTSEYNTGSDLLPWKMNDAMTILNGRIGIGSEDDRWTLEVWGQNLTDEEYYQVAFNGPLQGNAFGGVQQTSGPYAGSFYNPATDTATINAFLGAPRTYGVTLRVKY